MLAQIASKAKESAGVTKSHVYVPNLANNRSSGTASYWIPNEKPAPAIEKCRIIKRVEFTIAASIGKADSDSIRERRLFRRKETLQTMIKNVKANK